MLSQPPPSPVDASGVGERFVEAWCDCVRVNKDDGVEECV